MHIELKKIFQLGIDSLQQKNLVEAEKYFALLLSRAPEDHSNLILIGTLLAQNGYYERAKFYLLQAIDLTPFNTTPPYNLGLIFSLENNHTEAIKYYSATLRLEPNNIEALINQAASLNDLGRHEEAADSAKSAIQINPQIAQAWSNLGIAHRNLGKYEEALEAYDHAIQINSNFVEAIFNKGLTLIELGKPKEALPCFELTVRNQEKNAKAWLYLGNTQYSLNLLEDALTSYNQGLFLDQNYFEAWSNRGNLLGKLSRHSEALLSYDRALFINCSYADGLANKGYTLFELEKYDEALECFQAAYKLNPELDYLLGALVFTKIRLCSWDDYEKWVDLVSKKIKAHHKACSPFFSLAITGDLEIQSLAAKTYCQDINPINAKIPSFSSKQKNKKIRLAYLSSDFRSHAVSFLTAELFELHDRERFEVIALSSSPLSNDEMQLRLKRAFDQFIDVQNMADEDIALLSREMGIDIVIDLGGHTKDSRSRALAYRAAPVQINYLGFPGTMGSNFIDYIVADKILIPEKSESAYSEKVIYLPHCYQANDSKRKFSDRIFKKTDFSLPEKKFIFCCFNNPYKFSPALINSWIRILQETQNSILWLYCDHPSVEKNLKNIFQESKVESSRVIFSGKLSPEEYLSRYSLADLFLDTLPFNGGTTASDALWAGLPVLTFAGEAYASRMASSLLSNLNLGELIAQSAKDYENMAIDLATTPEKLQKIKVKLMHERINSPLFNSHKFTRNIEKAYIQVFERYMQNLPPERISISE